MSKYDQDLTKFISTREVPRKTLHEFAPAATQYLTELDFAVGAVSALEPQNRLEVAQTSVPEWHNPAVSQPIAAEAPIIGRDAPEVPDPRMAYGATAVQHFEQEPPEANPVYPEQQANAAFPHTTSVDPQTAHLMSAQQQVADAFAQGGASNFDLAA
jgi:hypothetical protein